MPIVVSPSSSTTSSCGSGCPSGARTTLSCARPVSNSQSPKCFEEWNKKLLKTIFVSMCLAVACSLSLDARAKDAPAQDVRRYTDGPVIEEDLIEVEYGHFEEYVDWLNSTWKPTMEALKKAGLITDYHVFRAIPNSPGQPNVILWIAFKNGMAALDKGAEIEDVAKKVICSTECQNKARVFRNQYRKVLGTQLIREIILH